MKHILYKETRLLALKLSYVFVASALLSLVPAYPILLGGFFTSLGIFYSFQAMRENRDIGYSLLLPVSKADIVKGKFAFVLLLEGASFIIMTIVTALRMSVLKDAAVYRENPLMGANLVFLGWALVMFGLFNLCFVRGFFKTAYYIGKPFVYFCVCAGAVILLAEALWHVPGLGALNAFGTDHIALQCGALAAGGAAFALMTYASLRRSVYTFEHTDL